MKDKIKGWEKVYIFTFVQKIKGKSYKIVTLFLLLIALISMPLISILFQEKEITSIKSIYILNEIDDINTEKFIWSLEEATEKRGLYKKIEYIWQDVSKEVINSQIKKADESYHKILLTISNTESGIILDFLYGENTGIKDVDINKYSSFLRGHLKDSFVYNMDLENDQIEYLKTPVEKKLLIRNESGGIVNTKVSAKALSMPLYTLGCIIFGLYAFIISINSEAISTSIITEKSSRVIEYIMISVKPMAIVVGKVFAMLSITIMSILIFIIGLLISVKLSPLGVPTVVKVFISSMEIGDVGVGIISLSILIFLVGFLMFSIISAMLGATVSRIEEAGEASKLYMIFMFIGIYMSMALIIMQMIGIDVSIFAMIVFLVPISSPIALPFYLIIGEASILVGIISFVILLICLILVTVFVSKVYGYILYHKGSKIKIRDLFIISKDFKKEVN